MYASTGSVASPSRDRRTLDRMIARSDTPSRLQAHVGPVRFARCASANVRFVSNDSAAVRAKAWPLAKTLFVLLALGCRSSDALQAPAHDEPSTSTGAEATHEIDAVSHSEDVVSSNDANVSEPANVVDESSCPDGVCTDGRPGAICAWGAHRGFSPRPEPAPCQAGLRCCPAGGAAGSDSTCRDVGDGPCPPFP